MSKLHFYRNIGGYLSKMADGDGEPDSSKAFNVLITNGTVQKGYVYEIRQGTSPSGSNYNCITGGSKGDMANFNKPSDENVLRANEEYLGAITSLQVALAASQKIVNIEIDTKDLQNLKASNYKLCFAKKVAQGKFNVVWQSYNDYLVSNRFSWIPQYQLFGSNIFQKEVKVKAATNIVNIGLGEQSILDSAGVLGQPSTGGPDISITLVNNFGSIHPGVNQVSTGINGQTVSTPIYVASQSILEGDATLTPVEKVLVWFEQNVETSTMFSDARSRSVEIDLTNTNEATRLYKNQEWSTP